MNDEAKKRMRRCAYCLHNHTVSPIELPMDTDIGDFCCFDTGGILLETRNLTEDFYQTGECPAGLWQDLPEIDYEAEEAWRTERQREEQVRRYGPVLEAVQDALDSTERKAVGGLLETRGILDSEARKTIDAELEGSGQTVEGA